MLKIFEEHWLKGDLYQLAIKEYNLLTSISPCAYTQNGASDALVFSLNPIGKVYSFAYQKSYTRYKVPPKKWITQGLVVKMLEGPRPQYKFKKYDQFGNKKLDMEEIKKKKEEDQPWYYRYWWAIALGVFFFMQALTPELPEEGQQAAAGGQGNAAQSRPAAR